MVWSITSSVKHGGSGLLKWTSGAATGTTSLLLIDDVTADGGSRWTGRWTDLNSQKVQNWEEGAPRWGRLTNWTILKAPDFNLNGGFFSDTETYSGCLGVLAILPCFCEHLSRQFYPSCFMLDPCESQMCPDCMWTQAQRQAEGARQMLDLSRVWTRAKCKAG